MIKHEVSSKSTAILVNFFIIESFHNKSDQPVKCKQPTIRKGSIAKRGKEEKELDVFIYQPQFANLDDPR
jgi:hypothetical protein